MEIKEADNVNLNVGLLRACANERSLFCRGVAPGSARVFRCAGVQRVALQSQQRVASLLLLLEQCISLAGRYHGCHILQDRRPPAEHGCMLAYIAA